MKQTTGSNNRTLSLLISTCLVAGATALASGQSEPFAGFDDLRQRIETAVGDGRLDFHEVPGLDAVGALDGLVIWPATIEIDADVPRLRVSGPIAVGDEDTTAWFEGTVGPDGALQLAAGFDRLSLGQVVGLVEQQTGKPLPRGAPADGGLVLEDVRMDFVPGDVASLTVSGRTTARGIEAEAMVSLVDRGEDGEEMLVGLRLAELDLRAVDARLAGTPLDLTLPEAIFSLRVPFHDEAGAAIDSVDLTAGAEEFFRRVFGEAEDFRLHLAPGINVFTRIPVTSLPAEVVDVLGMDPADALVLSGSLDLTLEALADSVDVDIEFLDLRAALPAVELPLPGWLASSTSLQRTLRITYSPPELEVRIVDQRSTSLDGAERVVEIETAIAVGGDQAAVGLHGRLAESWEQPFGIAWLSLDEVYFDFEAEGGGIGTRLVSSFELGRQTVGVSIEITGDGEDAAATFVASIEELSLAHALGVARDHLELTALPDRLASLGEDLSLTDVTLTIETDPSPSFTVSGTASLRGAETDVLLSLIDPGTDEAQILVSVRQHAFRLGQLVPAVHGGALDLRFPGLAFTTVQPIRDGALREVRIRRGDVSEDAARFLAEIYGAIPDAGLELEVGLNLGGRIPVSVLPPAVVSAMGLRTDDEIVLRGSVALDLALFTSGVSFEVTGLRLEAELPEVAPPAFPAWLGSPSFERTFVIEYAAPLVGVKLVDLVHVDIDGPRTFSFVTTFDTDGEQASASMVGRLVGGWEQPFGIDWMDLEEVGLSLEASSDGDTGRLAAALESSTRIGNKTVDLSIELARVDGHTTVTLSGAVDRLSTRELADLVRERFGIGSPFDGGGLDLVLEDVGLTFVAGRRPGFSAAATASIREWQCDFFVSVMYDKGEPQLVVAARPRQSLGLVDIVPPLADSPLGEAAASFRFDAPAFVVANDEMKVASDELTPEARQFFGRLYGTDDFKLDIVPGLGLIGTLPTPEDLRPLLDALGIDAGGPMTLQGGIPGGILGLGNTSGLAGLNLRAALPEMSFPNSPAWFVSGRLGIELTAAPSFGLYGEITVDIQGEVITFSQKAQISRTSLQLVGAMVAEEPWEQPFGIEWLTMNEVALVLDVNLSTQAVGVGFLGDMVIGEKDIRGAVFLAINVYSGVPTNFVFLGESETGVGMYDLVDLQARMAAIGGERGPAIPLAGLPDISVTDLGVRFAPMGYPALEVEQGFAVGGRLWIGSDNLAGVEIDVSFGGIIANGHVDRLSVGALSMQDVTIDVELTLARQMLAMAGRADLAFMQGAIDLEVSPSGMHFTTETEIFDRFRARLDARADSWTSPFRVHGELESDFNGELRRQLVERLLARRDEARARAEQARAQAEANLQVARDAFFAALDAAKEPARRVMLQAKANYDAAVRNRNAAYSAWANASRWQRPAKWAAYVYWRNVANSRWVAYNAARLVYQADLETWIANNPVLAALRQAREQLEAKRDEARARVERITAAFETLAQGPSAIVVRSATFDAELAVLERGSGIGMSLDLEVLGRPVHLDADWSFADMGASVRQLAESVLAEL